MKRVGGEKNERERKETKMLILRGGYKPLFFGDHHPPLNQKKKLPRKRDIFFSQTVNALFNKGF